MENIGEGDQLKPIDFDALGRYVSRVQWKQRLAQEPQNTQTAPETDDKTPWERIKAWGIRLGEKVIYPDIFYDHPQVAAIYTKLADAERLHAQRKAEKDGIRYTEITRRDLETQHALLNPDHKIYEILQRIGKRVTEAEEKIRQTTGLSRKEATSQFSFYVTRREVVNAYTYRNGRATFFESGFLVLFDQYLRETKGYGLAEDHLVGILVHEVSHSDPEAKLGFLNEEYCDHQGLILTAESGYNPYAMLDVEEFLIWLEEGDDWKKEPKEEEHKERERQNAYIPSHPDPKHRRMVIINALKDRNRVLPNQTEDFTPLEEEAVTDLERQMRDWQEKTQGRVLCRSREEIYQRIERAQNLNELLDILTGYRLFRRAEVVSTIVSDQEFMDRITLFQAVAFELKQLKNSVYFLEAGKVPNDRDLMALIIMDYYFNGYNTADLLIGGVARNLTPAETEPRLNEKDAARAEVTKTEVKQRLAQLEPKVIVETTDVMYDDESAVKEEKERRAKEESAVQSEKARELFNLLIGLDGKVDTAQILGGDFSQHPELKALLTSFGIENFDNYLGYIQTSFKRMSLNERTAGLQGERTNSLFPDQEILTQPVADFSQEETNKLLTQTSFYRSALFADHFFTDPISGRTNNYPLIYDQEFEDKIRQKIEIFGKDMSDVPEEQELFTQLISFWLLGGGDIEDIAEQIAGSVQVKKEGDNEKAVKFASLGLPRFLERFRIAPALGGPYLESCFHTNLFEGDRRTGYDFVDGKTRYGGKSFDFIRLLYGQMEFKEYDDYGRTKVRSGLRAKTFEDRLRLLHQRKKLIPSFGTELEEFDLEHNLDAVLTEAKDPQAKFKCLIELGRAAGFEKRYLKQIIFSTEVSAGERADFLRQALEQEEITLEEITDAFKDSSHYFSYRDDYLALKGGANTLMHLFKSLPVPLEKGADSVDFIFWRDLWQSKVQVAKYEYALEKERQRRIAQGIAADKLDIYFNLNDTAYEQIDIYEGLTEKERLEAELDDIFEFVAEGGAIRLPSEWSSWANYGVETEETKIKDKIEKLGYPLDQIRAGVERLLAANKERFSPVEIDKWQSLVAYCQQPHILDSEAEVLLRTQAGFQHLDVDNLDHILLMVDLIEAMPVCGYRDNCLGKLAEYATKAIRYRDFASPDLKEKARATINKNFPVLDFVLPEYIATKFLDHPARAVLEKRLSHLFAHGFSRLETELIAEYSDKLTRTARNANRTFIPASENCLTDFALSFSVGSSLASRQWEQYISESDRGSLKNALEVDYRLQEKFSEMDKTTVERTILFERLGLIQDMPDGQLKEALILYSLQTAWENLDQLENPADFQQEIQVLLDKYGQQFDSAQARQRVFEMRLSMELGGLSAKITPEAIRKRFPQRKDFLDYLTLAIPQKTSFRDGFIILASEAYPLRVGDFADLTSLMFSADYSTQDETVALQRAGLEIFRAVKDLEGTKTSDLRELVLWIIDEERQIKTVDDAIVNITTSPTGLKMLAGFLRVYQMTDDKGEMISLKRILKSSDFTDAEKLGAMLISGGAQAFIRLPLPIKRKMVTWWLRSRPVSKEGLASMTRIGMPKVIEQLSRLNIGKFSFNSIIESASLENPTTRQMFFDLMLGEKGVLEEPVVLDPETFTQRLREKFPGSEMHQFVDDILGIIYKKAKFDKKSQQVASIVAHSMVEGLSPVRRTVVLHKLLTELPKIDFSEPDQERLQSKILNLALSSIGILGAKLGQIDEVIPPGWGSQISGLKHGTKPMSFLAVANIFDNDGLSNDYVIEESAGAASTACGYFVRNPKGQEEFVKVVRPEVKLDWKGDFDAVKHMLRCLRASNLVQFESGPVIDQLYRLVEIELQTGREINNVLQYTSAETAQEMLQRGGGIRPVKMPLQRYGKDNQPIDRKERSLLILTEILGAKAGFIELSKLKSNPELSAQVDWEQINTMVVDDFLYRALVLGNFHADPHEGNIMVSLDGIVRRRVAFEDMVYIDFGQTGTVEGEARRANAARMLIGLGLYDRGEVAKAIHASLTNPKEVTVEMIKNDLAIKPNELQGSAMRALTKYGVEEYMTVFLKSAINILPYLRALPRSSQFERISRYMPQDMKTKLRTRLIAKTVQMI